MNPVQSPTGMTPPEELPSSQDASLVAAVLRKDRKATAEFVSRFADPVFGYLHSRLAPRDDLVEDLVQEVFLAAWERLSAFEGRSSLLSWLLGIARHKVEDHYRRILREPLQLERDDDEVADRSDGDPTFVEIVDRERLQKKTWQVLESLPEQYRTVLLWRYWEHRSAQDVAEQTGRTAKAVERLLARAREQFRRRWNDE